MQNQPNRRFSLREKASCLSILMFWWLKKLLYTGWKRTLTEEDVFPVLYSDHSAILGARLEHFWFKHLQNCAKRKKKPSLRWTMFLAFGPRFFLFGIFSMLEECVFRMIQVISLGFLIQYFDPAQVKTNTMTIAQLSCAGIILASVCFLVSFHWSIFSTHHVCTHMRLSISAMIYRKTLKLSQATMRTFSVGQLVTLLSSDVHRLDMQDLHLNYLWIAPLQLTVVIYLLYYHYGFGLPSLGGLVLLIIFVIFQFIMSRYISKVRLDKIVATNKRMRIITEIMNTFYTIKMYGWEAIFYDKAKASRQVELGFIKKTMMLRILNTSFALILTKMTVFFTLLLYVYCVNEPLNSQRVFITLLLYEHVRINLAFLFTQGATDFAEVSVTLRRITEFLLLEERSIDPHFYEVTKVDPDASLLSIQLNGVKMENMCCKWHPDQPIPTLDNVNLDVREGKLLAIVGPIGCSKSSFLYSILGELPVTSGKITVQGTVSYVSQTPWLFPGTIRQNIIFGKMYDADWYSQVIEICGLKPDFDSMEDGDQTKVVRAAFSVGQKARVGLARAVYSNSDIYLMDDPLNCVDVRLSRHILETCIRGALKNKVVLLVTHQLHFLEAADNILILLEGKIRALGTFKELTDSGIHFSKEVDESAEIEEEDMDDESELDMQRSRRNSILTVEEEAVTHRLIVKEQVPPPGTDTVRRTLGGEISIAKSALAAKDAEASDELFDQLIAPDKIGIKLFWSYIYSSSSWYLITFLLFLCIAVQCLYSGSDYWLEHWTVHEESRMGKRTSFQAEERQTEIIIYCSLIPSLVFVSFLRSIAMFKVCMNASMTLFCQLLSSLLHAKSRFLESSCAGHGINRFSKDMVIIDELLPSTLYDISGVAFEILGATVILCYTNYWFFIPSVLYILTVSALYSVYKKSAITLKRLEANARSPVYAHTIKTLDGLTTIRSFGQERIFMKIYDDLQDKHTSAWYLYASIHAWLSVAVDWLSILLISAVAIGFIYLDTAGVKLHAPEVGLAVAKVIELSILMQIAVTEAADSETEMISVERILEYTHEEGEGPWDIPETKPPVNWPYRGHIVFKNVNLEGYGNKILLKDINVEIKPGEKVGIIGRSGSGKSTFINALFRITEPKEGSITLDDVDILKLGLHDLRRNISVIPQTPHVFAGSLRMNLDPFDEFLDTEIWAVLEEVNLFETIKKMEAGLDTQFTETGWQFSAGQSQLIGLARAMLKKNKILCLDEATANLDPETQSLMLKKIKEKFHMCTVITIAHRLHTVIDCDKIMVLEAGHIVDFGEPHQLLKDKGPFYSFVTHLGRKNAEDITRLAKEASTRRRGRRSLGAIYVDGQQYTGRRPSVAKKPSSDNIKDNTTDNKQPGDI